MAAHGEIEQTLVVNQLLLRVEQPRWTRVVGDDVFSSTAAIIGYNLSLVDILKAPTAPNLAHLARIWRTRRQNSPVIAPPPVQIPER